MKTLKLEDLRFAERYRHTVNGGTVAAAGSGIRFTNPAASGNTYINAQIDDYRGLRRSAFTWRPPLVLSIRARFSHHAKGLQGTAGFGFWNDPFMMTTLRPPTLPQALWFFFASAPSDMALAQGVPGRGWKAATIDARRPAFLALAPTAPLALPLMHSPWLYEKLWPTAQRALGVHEALLDVEMRDWYEYVIVWHDAHVEFRIDGTRVLEARPTTGGPLGLVIWLDNQVMIVTPQGKIRHSLLARTEAQWMEIEQLAIEMGSSSPT